jgi:cell volume regulation protein A
VSETRHFAVILLIIAVVGLVGVLSNRLTEKLRVPTPVLVLIGAAVAVKVIPQLHAPPERIVEQILTVALVMILFDGGIGIGADRFRAAAGPIALVGVLGTFLTAIGGAVLLHLAFGLSWYLALLVATAIAPTDPAVVFSVLGQREIAGRSGTILKGESGANDPVGIALMSALLTARELSGSAIGHVALEFLQQMAVGAVVGLLGGRALLEFMRKVSLPQEGLYPIRALAWVALLYGLTTLLGGSGFLAVLLAGVVVGDERAPYKREVERFHAALASLAELVAFVVLGLTVDLGVLSRADVWVPGLVLSLVVAFVVRPVFVGLCLLPARLRRNENLFVLLAGLKGAVPLLLGELLLGSHVPHAARLFGIIAVVVIFSVLVQGSATPFVAEWLQLPTRPVELEPWALGVRLREEPSGVHRFRVKASSLADGKRIDELDELPQQSWISFVVRNSDLVLVSGDTQLEPGDEVLVLGSDDSADAMRRVFEGVD